MQKKEFSGQQILSLIPSSNETHWLKNQIIIFLLVSFRLLRNKNLLPKKFNANKIMLNYRYSILLYHIHLEQQMKEDNHLNEFNHGDKNQEAETESALRQRIGAINQKIQWGQYRNEKVGNLTDHSFEAIHQTLDLIETLFFGIQKIKNERDDVKFKLRQAERKCNEFERLRSQFEGEQRVMQKIRQKLEFEISSLKENEVKIQRQRDSDRKEMEKQFKKLQERKEKFDFDENIRKKQYEKMFREKDKPVRNSFEVIKEFEKKHQKGRNAKEEYKELQSNCLKDFQMHENSKESYRKHILIHVFGRLNEILEMEDEENPLSRNEFSDSMLMYSLEWTQKICFNFDKKFDQFKQKCHFGVVKSEKKSQQRPESQKKEFNIEDYVHNTNKLMVKNSKLLQMSIQVEKDCQLNDELMRDVQKAIKWRDWEKIAEFQQKKEKEMQEISKKMRKIMDQISSISQKTDQI